MTGAANNINDLLGIGAGSNGNSSGNSSTPDPGDSTFSALLSMLSGLGLNTLSPSSPTSKVADPIRMLPTIPGLMAPINLNFNINPAMPSSSQADLDKDSGPEPQSAAPAPISLVGLSSKTLSQLAAAQLPQTTVTSQLPKGNYNIISAAIVGDKLDLHLASKDNPKAELHVTLPADLVNSSVTPTTVADPSLYLAPKSLAAPSTSLESHGAPRQNLADLIAQLNITEVSIEKTPAIVTGSQQAGTTVKFLNAANPAAPALVAVVPAAQLKAFTNPQAKPAEPSATDLSDSDSNASSQRSETKPSILANTGIQNNASKSTPPVQPTIEQDPQPLFRTAAVRISSKVMTQDSPLIQKLLNDSDAAEISPFKLDLSGDSLKALNMIRPTTSNAPALDQPAVRISLPQNLSGLLDNPGRSINIKLEPDYLGPARLTLSMRGESLSAKLTVDTPQAKAAVENSITQLTDQLARVGIKVDHFDVSMRGGGADSQAFHRPQDWFTPQRARVTQREDDPFIEHSMKIETTNLPPATYLSRRSVNLYA